MPSTAQASIIILTFNNLDYTRMCLESVCSRTDPPGYEIVVVDNASHDGTQQFLKEFAGRHAPVKLVLNETNQGFATGNNRGAAAASAEYIVFLNNDTVVTPGWLSGLIRHLQDPAVGMVGPVTNSSANECRIPVDYEAIQDMEAFAGRYTDARQGQAREVSMLPFQCVAMRRAVFEEIGPLDERFGIGMFEDDDYALRVKQKGYRILCAEDVFIHHWGSASFSTLDRREYLHIFSTNWRQFEEKWGIRWHPPSYQADLLPEQLRQYLYDVLQLSWKVSDQEEFIKTLQAKVDELEAIKNSTSWKMLCWARSLIIPPGSRRESWWKSYFGKRAR